MIETALMFGILFGIVLGAQIHYVLFSTSILSLILLYLYDRRRKVKQIKLIKDRIKAQWGKDNTEKMDSSQINRLYEYLLEKDESEFCIDDITWRDLNMDTVFRTIDCTKSLPGMHYLYRMLRKPLFLKNRVKEINEISESLLENDELAREIQYPLHILGKKQGKKIFDYFVEGITVDTKPLWWITI